MSNFRNLYITDPDDSDNKAKVDTTGQLHVVLEGDVIEENSSDTPLKANKVFTGEAIDTCKYALFLVNVWADQASATDGLSVQFSSDGVNWDHLDVFTIPASTGKVFSFQTAAQYMRVVYTNGAVAQTEFRLQVIGKKSYSKPSSHRTADSISSQDDAELVKSVITAEEFLTGIFKNIQAQILGSTAQNIDGSYGLIVAAQLMGRVSDSLVAPVYTDASTQELVQLSHEHHEIHEGAHFYMHGVDDLSINAVIDFRLTTPDSPTQAHMTFGIITESETEFYMYEGVSITVAGATATPLNNDRNSSNTSVLDIDYIANSSVANADLDTDITTATEIQHNISGAGKDSGVLDREREIILKQNTVYCFRFIANTAGFVNYNADWYEHASKN